MQKELRKTSSKSLERNRGSRTFWWHFLYLRIRWLNFFIIIVVNKNRLELLSETAHFTECLFRVHPESLMTMLIATPAEVSFKNYLLRPFTYLTAGAVWLHNNTFIPHCTNWVGRGCQIQFLSDQKMTLKRLALWKVKCPLLVIKSVPWFATAAPP